MKMIQLDPSKRISVKEAIAHPYFEGVSLSGLSGDHK
jgi:hypothetical protein